MHPVWKLLCCKSLSHKTLPHQSPIKVKSELKFLISAYQMKTIISLSSVKGSYSPKSNPSYVIKKMSHLTGNQHYNKTLDLYCMKFLQYS